MKKLMKLKIKELIHFKIFAIKGSNRVINRRKAKYEEKNSE